MLNVCQTRMLINLVIRRTVIWRVSTEATARGRSYLQTNSGYNFISSCSRCFCMLGFAITREPALVALWGNRLLYFGTVFAKDVLKILVV